MVDRSLAPSLAHLPWRTFPGLQVAGITPFGIDDKVPTSHSRRKAYYMSIFRVQMTAILITATLLGGCAVQSAATYKVKPSLRQECVQHCTTLGMELGAVVLMMDHAGCVCSPQRTQKEIAEAGAATLGGNVTIAAVQAAAAAAQQQHIRQQQQQQQQHWRR